MSNLMQFLGGGIKSIQRGTTSVTVGVTTVTISSVNTAKTIVNHTGFTTATTSYTGVMAYLTNATTLKLIASESAVVKNISWEVVEYY